MPRPLTRSPATWYRCQRCVADPSACDGRDAIRA
jgi:hypothetical protein